MWKGAICLILEKTSYGWQELVAVRSVVRSVLSPTSGVEFESAPVQPIVEPRIHAPKVELPRHSNCRQNVICRDPCGGHFPRIQQSPYSRRARYRVHGLVAHGVESLLQVEA
jgi:hypothetical protein